MWDEPLRSNFTKTEQRGMNFEQLELQLLSKQESHGGRSSFKGGLLKGAFGSKRYSVEAGPARKLMASRGTDNASRSHSKLTQSGQANKTQTAAETASCKTEVKAVPWQTESGWYRAPGVGDAASCDGPKVYSKSGHLEQRSVLFSRSRQERNRKDYQRFEDILKMNPHKDKDAFPGPASNFQSSFDLTSSYNKRKQYDRQLQKGGQGKSQEHARGPKLINKLQSGNVGTLELPSSQVKLSKQKPRLTFGPRPP